MQNKRQNRKNKKQPRTAKAVLQRSPMLAQSPAIRVTLPYYSVATLTSATPAAWYTFSLNNVYDPDVSGTGEQPLGFDQYSQFYGRYRVMGVRFVIEFVNTTTSAMNVGCFTATSSSLPSTTGSWFVQPLPATASRLLSVSGGGRDHTQVSGSPKIWDVLGVTQREYITEMDFAATTGGGPARQAFIHLVANGLGGIPTIRCTFRAWYDVEFSQAVALNLS